MSPLLLALLLASPVHLALEAPEDAPPDAALSWIAWSHESGDAARPVLPAEHVGGTAPREVHAELPEGAPWTVLVQGESGGDAWFAVSLSGNGTAAAPLQRVPVPQASFDDGALRLSWERVAPGRGVTRWQVLRHAAGETALVGEVGGGAASFVDEPPAGETTWSLRPVLAHGVTGPVGRASDPVLVAIPAP